MERLEALLDDACGRAPEVQRAADPQAAMRALLAPLRLELQVAAAAARGERKGSVPAAKAPTAYFSEAATRLQALVLGGANAHAHGPRPAPAASVTSSSSSNKSFVEAPKTPKPAGYLSGAASRLQALVRGTSASSSTNSANATALVAAKDVQVVMPQEEAATRIQALLRGKSERRSFVRQQSFLLQGTKVGEMCVIDWVDE